MTVDNTDFLNRMRDALTSPDVQHERAHRAIRNEADAQAHEVSVFHADDDAVDHR